MAHVDGWREAAILFVLLGVGLGWAGLGMLGLLLELVEAKNQVRRSGPARVFDPSEEFLPPPQ